MSKKRNYNKIIQKVLISAFAIIFLVLLIVPFYFFFKHLYSPNFSKDIADWGNFGDYFGGALNPIFAFLNVIVLIWLAWLANQINKNIAVFQIKQQSYQLYVNKLNELFFNVIEFYTNYLRDRNEIRKKDFEITLEILKMFLQNFLIEIKELISEEEFNDYKTELSSFIENIDEFKKNYMVKDSLSFSKFIDSKSEFIRIVNKNLKVK